MNKTDTAETKRKQTATLFFNLAIIIASFTVALVALPQEMFFVVAIIILFALREIEKDVTKSEPRRFSIFTQQ